jgi:hypothetical protein
MIPLEIGAMPKLQVLRLDHNHFTGKVPESLLKRAPELQVIDYSNNNLEN